RRIAVACQPDGLAGNHHGSETSGRPVACSLPVGKTSGRNVTVDGKQPTAAAAATAAAAGRQQCSAVFEPPEIVKARAQNTWLCMAWERSDSIAKGRPERRRCAP